MKRIISLLLSAILIIGTVCCVDFYPLAAGVVERGNCGEGDVWSGDFGHNNGADYGSNVKWALNKSTGVMEIYGEGEMGDFYTLEVYQPWKAYQSLIKTVYIYEGVTKIGAASFAFCSNIREVYLPSTIESMDSYAFYDTSSLRTVYSSASKDDYHGPSAINFTVKYDCKKLYHSLVDEQHSVLSSENLFMVYDNDKFLTYDNSFVDSNVISERAELANVNVTYGSHSQNFNASVYIDLEDMYNNDIVFKKTGYRDYIIPKETTARGSDYFCDVRHDIYMTKDDGTNRPYISSVFARRSDSSSDKYIDITHEKIEVIKDCKYDIVIKSSSNSCNYFISQDDLHRIESTTGVFENVDLYSVFEKNRTAFAYVTENGKTSEPIKLLMSVSDVDSSLLGLLEGNSFNLLGKDGFSVNIGKSVPVLGGMKLASNCASSPFGIEIDNNKIKVSLGVNIFKETTTYSGTKTTGIWESFKKSCDTVNKKTLESENKMDAFNNAMEASGWKGFKEKNNKVNVNFLGYIELQLINGHMHVTSFSGTLAASIVLEYVHQGVVCGCVPYYAYIQGKLQTGVKVSGVQIVPDSNVPFDFDVDFSCGGSIKLGAGVGVKNAISAGAYIKGSLDYLNELTEKHHKLTLSGELGVEGEWENQNVNETLLSGQRTIFDEYYGGTSKSSKNSNLASKSADESTLQPANRDYLENMTDWLPDGDEYDESSSLLQQSIYPECELKTVRIGDKVFAAWIEDCRARDDLNKKRLVYSVYNLTNGEWSTPAAVCDENLDSSLDVKSDGRYVYLAWQKCNRLMTAEDTISELTASTEIYYSKYDISSGEFVETRAITDNNKYDYNPSVVIGASKIGIAWLSNNSYDLIRPDSNTINVFDLTSESTWSSDGLNYVSSYAVYYDENNNINAYCSEDSDGDITTLDYSVSNIADASAAIDTESNISNIKIINNGNFENTVFFNDFNSIYYIADGEAKPLFETPYSIIGDFKILEINSELSLVFCSYDGEETSLYQSFYIDDGWTEPVKINGLNNNVNYFSCEESNDGLFIMYSSGKETTDMNYNLVGKAVSASIDALDINEADMEKGEDSDIYISVKNTGTSSINSLRLNITDGLGTDITEDFDVNLEPGESDTLQVKYTVPNSFRYTQLNVKAYLPNESTELCSKSEYIGYADLVVRENKIEDVGDCYIVTNTVTNMSCVTASNVYFGENNTVANNGVISTTDPVSLRPYESVTFQNIYKKDNLNYNSDGLYKLSFKATTSTNERVTANNEIIIYLEKPHEHTLVETDRQEPTCVDDGYITKQCEVCGEYVTVTLSKKGHSYKKYRVFPDCVNEGYCEYVCEVCGYSYNDDFVQAKGHEYGLDSLDDYLATIYNSDGKFINSYDVPETYGATSSSSSSVGIVSQRANCVLVNYPNEIKINNDDLSELDSYCFQVKRGGSAVQRTVDGIFAYRDDTGRSPEQSAIPYTDSDGNLVNMNYVDYYSNGSWKRGRYKENGGAIVDESGNTVAASYENTRPHIEYTRAEAASDGILNDDGTVNVTSELVKDAEPNSITFATGIDGIYFNMPSCKPTNSDGKYVNVFAYEKGAHPDYGRKEIKIGFYNSNNTAYGNILLTIFDNEMQNVATEASDISQVGFIRKCVACDYSCIEYENVDKSALIAALERANELSADDYSAESFGRLMQIVNNSEYLINVSAQQSEYDNAVFEILTAISELEPYLNLSVFAENGEVEVEAETKCENDGIYSVLFGNEITLSATADEGYEFAGWYDASSGRIFSADNAYTFKITSNTTLNALFVKNNSASVFFKNDSGYIKEIVTKAVDEWNAVNSIADILPNVPYEYGSTNGRWVYDNAEVLAKLRNGENVDIVAEYDKGNVTMPRIPKASNATPALTLAYSLDSDNNVGSFIMSAGIPDGCEIEAIGIAFYYKKASEFNPVDFDLTINNKMMTSKFEPSSESGYYTVDINKFTSYYNWAAKGYVSYYDSSGNLKTAYTNQVSIVDRQNMSEDINVYDKWMPIASSDFTKATNVVTNGSMGELPTYNGMGEPMEWSTGLYTPNGNASQSDDGSVYIPDGYIYLSGYSGGSVPITGHSKWKIDLGFRFKTNASSDYYKYSNRYCFMKLFVFTNSLSNPPVSDTSSASDIYRFCYFAQDANGQCYSWEADHSVGQQSADTSVSTGSSNLAVGVNYHYIAEFDGECFSAYITDENGAVVQEIVTSTDETFISRLNNISDYPITSMKIGDDNNSYFFCGLEYQNITFYSWDD